MTQDHNTQLGCEDRENVPTKMSHVMDQKWRDDLLVLLQDANEYKNSSEFSKPSILEEIEKRRRKSGSKNPN